MNMFRSFIYDLPLQLPQNVPRRRDVQFRIFSAVTLTFSRDKSHKRAEREWLCFWHAFECRSLQHVQPPHLHSIALAAFNCTDRGRPIDSRSTIPVARSVLNGLVILVTVKSNWIIDHRCVRTHS